jgi:hypothetical protein
LRLAQQPRVHRFVPLLVLTGIMLFCLGILPSLPLTTPDASSALAESNAEQVHKGADDPTPLPDGSYPLTPAQEAQEAFRYPVNVYLLTMLLLACSFGASVLRMLLTNTRRQAAICSRSGADRTWVAVAHEDPAFLGVFRL